MLGTRKRHDTSNTAKTEAGGVNEMDDIEVISRHMSDLGDYLYEPEPSVITKETVEVK